MATQEGGKKKKQPFALLGLDVLPHLYRIFKGNVQLVPASLSSLNSHATYLLVLDHSRRLIGWCGQNASKTDFVLMKETADEVILKDFGDKSAPGFPIIIEGSEVPEILIKFLDIFWTVPEDYISRLAMAERRALIHNSPVSVGQLIATSKGQDKFEIKETTFAHPDANGTVPRVMFTSIETDTIAYVSVGDQWDLWFARGVTPHQKEEAQEFVQSLIDRQAILTTLDNPNAINKEALKNYIVLVEQGNEGVLFRKPLKIFTDFEPTGKTLKKAPKHNLLLDFKAATQDVAMKKPPLPTKKAVSALPSKQSLDVKQLSMDEREMNRVDFWNDVSVVKGKKRVPNKLEMTGAQRASSPPKLQANGVLFEITPYMLQIIEQENISIEKRKLLIEEACLNPIALLGWQVEIDEGLFKGVFVVVGCRKTLMSRKSIFHLSATGGEEFWVKLKRGDKKRGVRFRPLRQVAILQ